MKPCDENIRKTFRLIHEMIALADQGDMDREDVGCGILFGIMRDSAYRLKQIADKEKAAHVRKGWWRDAAD